MTIFNPISNTRIRLILDSCPEQLGGQQFMPDYIPLEWVINDEDERPGGFSSY